jgi:hypothetical protein
MTDIVRANTLQKARDYNMYKYAMKFFDPKYIDHFYKYELKPLETVEVMREI